MLVLVAILVLTRVEVSVSQFPNLI
jgi:hypothetical protein